jgi:hypothetical protein
MHVLCDRKPYLASLVLQDVQWPTGPAPRSLRPATSSTARPTSDPRPTRTEKDTKNAVEKEEIHSSTNQLSSCGGSIEGVRGSREARRPQWPFPLSFNVDGCFHDAVVACKTVFRHVSKKTFLVKKLWVVFVVLICFNSTTNVCGISC